MIQKKIDVTHFIHAIQILFLGTFLVATSNFLALFNSFELFGFVFHINGVTELIGYLGQLVIYFFPLILLIMYVKNKYKDGQAILIAIIAYAVILFVTMILGKGDMPKHTYIPYFSFDTASGVKRMYQLGLVGTYITAKLVNFIQMNFRRKGVGFFAFLDKEIYPILITISLSLLVGLSVTYIWPYVISGIEFVTSVIARNINSPFNLFLYNVIERMLGILGLRELFSTPFLFDIAGGSYLSNNGTKVLGDIMIWQRQYLDGVLSPLTGRFAVVNYAINLAIIPGIITSVYSLVSDKKEKIKYLFVYIIAIFTLMMAGNAWFGELMLVVLAPTFFVVYVIVVGLMGGYFLVMNTIIGAMNVENTIVWQLGTFNEYLRYWGDMRMADKAYMILGIGIVIALIFFFLIRYYLKNAGFASHKNNRLPFELENLVDALGGIENITSINSTVAKVTIELKERHNIDVQQLKGLGASGIVESKKSIVLVFGTLSPYIAKELEKFVKLAK